MRQDWTCIAVVDIVIMIADQHVLFNKYVCAACRAVPAARQLEPEIHAHALAMLGIDVLSEGQRCCSAIDRTRCFAGTPEGELE
jgi:hypothetical protein